MHPDSKDYTQRVIAWSILLDGSGCWLVEEFVRLFFTLNEKIPLLWEKVRLGS